MKSLSKRYIIKVPKNISVLYCQKNKIVTFFTDFVKKSFALKTKIVLIKNKKLLKVTKIPFLNKKETKEMQGTTVALLKQMLLEIFTSVYKKLKFVGVGYKAFSVKVNNLVLLNFKLGYSHQIFLKIPADIKIFCLKSSKLFISGTSNQYVNQITALIRSYKIPEPYKGKGILYENEKIILKEGKKV